MLKYNLKALKSYAIVHLRLEIQIGKHEDGVDSAAVESFVTPLHTCSKYFLSVVNEYEKIRRSALQVHQSFLSKTKE